MLHYIQSENSLNDGESPTNFSHNLTLPENHNKISLVNLSFPKAYYLVNSPYNDFQLDDTIYTIPEGNYSIDNFITVVNVLINPSICVFSKLLGKFILSSTATNLIFPATTRLHNQFGFLQDSSNSFSEGEIMSQNVVNFQSLSQVFVCCNLISDLSAEIYDNLLMSFSVNNESDFNNVNFYNIQIHETAKNLNFLGTGQRLTTIPMRIKFLDQYGNIIDTNGLNTHFTIKTFREHNELNDLIKTYIKFRISEAKEKRLKK
jgi:hypothetical protein